MRSIIFILCLLLSISWACDDSSCRKTHGGVEVCDGVDLCAYNGGSHTTPLELFSAQLFIYR